MQTVQRNWSWLILMNNVPMGLCACSDKARCCTDVCAQSRMDTLQPEGGVRHEGRKRRGGGSVDESGIDFLPIPAQRQPRQR